MRVKSRRLRNGVRLAALLALVGGLLPVVETTAAPPAQALFGISERKGIDGCSFDTNAETDAFYDGTPYWNLGVYIGGSAYSPGCSLLSGPEIIHAKNYGWESMLLWVGPQPPCTQISAPKFSSNTTTANQQGKNEAVAIYNRLIALGIDRLDTPVIYDFEPWNVNNSGCVAAAKSFIQGFVAQMHLPPAQKAGLYGSTCASGLYHFASITNRPDFITGAAWDNNPKVSVMPCISSGSWAVNSRHKQYRGDHNETWNGVTILVDSDCSDGPVWDGPNELNIGQGCV
ncbi:MAG: DUF1906 domain-containing protein [Sporichthyaceae bacterium]|nr:DUF1906 domain-containing protein [Sporichthyaceae bacterium]